jgi:hypothetical protein
MAGIIDFERGALVQVCQTNAHLAIDYPVSYDLMSSSYLAVCMGHLESQLNSSLTLPIWAPLI